MKHCSTYMNTQECFSGSATQAGGSSLTLHTEGWMQNLQNWQTCGSTLEATACRSVSSRDLKVSPTGDIASTMCRLALHCSTKKAYTSGGVIPLPALFALGVTASMMVMTSSLANRFGTCSSCASQQLIPCTAHQTKALMQICMPA